MPQTDVALGLREAHLHPEFFGEGWYTHATGFAIDWRAYVAPHITDPSLIALFETVTGGPPHFDLGMDPRKRLDLIEQMGQGTADPAAAAALLQRIETEYERVATGSEKFRKALPESSLAPLREIEAAHRDVLLAQAKLKGLRDRRAKKAAIDEAMAELAAATEKLDALEPQLKQIFEPLTRRGGGAGEIRTRERGTPVTAFPVRTPSAASP